ncbi:MAG: hypothetical protein ACUVQI_07710 [Thermochromatium sp.]
MPLCPQCDRPLWSFVMILGLTGVIAFLTWLILGLSPIAPWQRLVATLVVTNLVGGILLYHVINCLRRHCRHGQTLAQGRP